MNATATGDPSITGVSGGGNAENTSSAANLGGVSVEGGSGTKVRARLTAEDISVETNKEFHDFVVSVKTGDELNALSRAFNDSFLKGYKDAGPKAFEDSVENLLTEYVKYREAHKAPVDDDVAVVGGGADADAVAIEEGNAGIEITEAVLNQYKDDLKANLNQLLGDKIGDNVLGSVQGIVAELKENPNLMIEHPEKFIEGIGPEAIELALIISDLDEFDWDLDGVVIKKFDKEEAEKAKALLQQIAPKLPNKGRMTMAVGIPGIGVSAILSGTLGSLLPSNPQLGAAAPWILAGVAVFIGLVIDLIVDIKRMNAVIAELERTDHVLATNVKPAEGDVPARRCCC